VAWLVNMPLVILSPVGEESLETLRFAQSDSGGFRVTVGDLE